MRVAAALAAASLTLAAASVTACSAGSKTADGGSAPTGTGATSAAAAPGTSGAAGAAAAASSAAGKSGPPGGAANFDVCTALSASAASQITGITFTTTKPRNVANQIFSCEYGGANDALLQVSVAVAGGKVEYDVDVKVLKSVGHGPDSVTGVGDEAFSMPKPGTAGAQGASAFASYGAVFGDVYIKIGGLTYV